MAILNLITNIGWINLPKWWKCILSQSYVVCECLDHLFDEMSRMKLLVLRLFKCRRREGLPITFCMRFLFLKRLVYVMEMELFVLWCILMQIHEKYFQFSTPCGMEIYISAYTVRAHENVDKSNKHLESGKHRYAYASGPRFAVNIIQFCFIRYLIHHFKIVH